MEKSEWKTVDGKIRKTPWILRYFGNISEIMCFDYIILSTVHIKHPPETIVIYIHLGPFVLYPKWMRIQ